MSNGAPTHIKALAIGIAVLALLLVWGYRFVYWEDQEWAQSDFNLGQTLYPELNNQANEFSSKIEEITAEYEQIKTEAAEQAAAAEAEKIKGANEDIENSDNSLID